METYYITYKKKTLNENSSVRRTKQNRLMPLSNCAICGKKKSRFIKTLLNQLGIRTLLSNIPLTGNILF